MAYFHPLHTDILPPERMNNPFYYHPHPLCELAARDLQMQLPAEPAEGKMYGVLVVRNEQQQLGYLAAYSGQIEMEGEEYVPAVFDYLQPDGYFKTHEDVISGINHDISLLQKQPEYLSNKEKLTSIQHEADQQIARKTAAMKEAKRIRDERRKDGNLSDEELQQMTRESQFLKAEVHRCKVEYRKAIEEAESRCQQHEELIRQLKLKRKMLSDALQNWLFTQFRFMNAEKKEMSLMTIWQQYSSFPQPLPPSGSGECCEPKLLQHAYLNNLQPLCMAMFWWGPSPKTELRRHGQFYPACHGKCLPILTWMLQGLDVERNSLEDDIHQELEIVYDDKDIVVVNKPAGMLSVPGKSQRESVLSIIRERYPEATGPMIVHRLDMATSGLLVVAKNMDCYIHLQKQFASHTIRKRYLCILSGKWNTSQDKKGLIKLPLIADIMDRPRQKVDHDHGKEAITEYEWLKETGKGILMALYPHTGRTHQLRVHCAHHEGLNNPILGDELYGNPSDRLYLHAASLELTHPTTGKRMTFERLPQW